MTTNLVEDDHKPQPQAPNTELTTLLRRLSISTRAAGLGIWETDLASDREEWDDTMYAIYGVARQSFTPSQAAWRALVHPADLPLIVDAERIEASSGTRFHHLFRIVRPDGEVRWIESDAEVAFDAAGKAQRLIGVNRDVTEKVLSEQQHRLRLVALEAAANGILITDRNGAIEWVNPAFTTLTGYTLAEAIGKNPRELVRSGKHPPAFYQQMWDTILSGNVWRGELINRRKDGSLYHEEQTITPVTNDAGVITHFIGVKQDISARMQEESERNQLLARVQMQADQLAQIMRSVPDGVALLDTTRRIVQANPLAEVLLGRLAPDALEGTLTRLGDRLLDEILSPSPPGGWHLVRTSTEEFEVAAQPVAAGPLAAGWVLVIRNVTERRALHRQLERQERLAAVGQLTAGIAHDFNNIMSVIVAYAQLLGETPGLSERKRSELNTIQEQALRATQMIRQMHYDQAEHIIRADPTRIQQLLLNLAINARDAMPHGGLLRIELSQVHLDAAATPLPTMPPGDWLRLRVSDTGVGMTSDVLNHIFEPFFTTKPPGQGTGLGLAQVYGIVAQHEGHIVVESAPGAGATFSLYFPAVEVLDGSNVVLASTSVAHLPHGHGELVLVVEDEEVVRRSLVELLGILHYRTCEAGNGVAALQMLEEQAGAIDLVLSDVVMPQSGGLRLLQEMQRRGYAIPLILLTGHALGIDLEELRSQGLSGWLAKPPPIKELAEAVAQALHTARRPAPASAAEPAIQIEA